MTERSDVLKLAKAYFKDHHPKERLIPGEDYIPASGKILDEEDLEKMIDASLDMWLTQGRYGDLFEKCFADYLQSRFCILTNSGSSANLIALTALTSPLLKNRALKKGDEVITLAAGFPTTVAPIIQNGLVPVFTDVELGTYNCDITALKAAITPKTKAIFMAHTLGNPFDIKAVKKLAEEYDLFVIEDNCDALGAEVEGQKTGTFGDLSTYSFYPAHHMTMGEGGAVVTSDPLLYKIIKSIRDWGRDCVCAPGQDNFCGQRFTRQYGHLPYGYDHKYVYSHLGYNLKVTDMQAALGVSQLKKLDGFIIKRRENHRILDELLEPLGDYLILPKALPDSDPSWFGYVITLKDGLPFKRDELLRYLEDHKIGTRLLFAGNILDQPCFVDNDYTYRISGTLANTDKIMNDTFWIGVFPKIDRDCLVYVANTLKTFLKDKGLKVA